MVSVISSGCGVNVFGVIGNVWGDGAHLGILVWDPTLFNATLVNVKQSVDG